MKRLVPLLGRIFLSAIFLLAGLDKIAHPALNQDYMARYGVPYSSVFLVVAILVEVLGGLSILLGFKARWGAAGLALFLVLATLIFHTDFSDEVQIGIFLRNLSILGGLLLIAHFGPGAFSLDN